VPADPLTANVWMVGGGIASMAEGAFLIRDAGVPGENIHVLETLDVPGGKSAPSGRPARTRRLANQPAGITPCRRAMECGARSGDRGR